MKKDELIRLIAENLSKNTMDAVFPYPCKSVMNGLPGNYHPGIITI